MACGVLQCPETVQIHEEQGRGYGTLGSSCLGFGESILQGLAVAEPGEWIGKSVPALFVPGKMEFRHQGLDV